jgi:hypothetical protein
MANIEFKEAVVRLTFEAGQTQDGKVIKRAKSYRRVYESATADQLAEITSILSGFSSYPLLGAEKIETGNILN